MNAHIETTTDTFTNSPIQPDNVSPVSPSHKAIEECLNEMIEKSQEKVDFTIDIPPDEENHSPFRKHSSVSSITSEYNDSKIPILTFHYGIIIKLPHDDKGNYDKNVLNSVNELLKRLTFGGIFIRLESRESTKKKIKMADLKLIFLLHVPDIILSEMQHKMEIERWVAGGRHAQHFLAPQHGPLTSADRIVLIDRYLNCPKHHGGLSIHEINHIFRIFPLHDDNFNKEIINSWLFQWSEILLIFKNKKYIEKIRYQYGEKIALYYVYMDFYTKWLIPLAIWGLFIYFLSAFSIPLFFQLSAITGIFVSTIWGTLFLIFWKRKRSELCIKWSIGKKEDENRMNPLFKSHLNNYLIHIKYKRRLKYLFGYIILILFLILEIVITIGFVDLYFFLKSGCAGHCSINGFENWVLVLCQGILLGLVVDIIQYQIFRVIAIRLTKWENHPTEKRYENSRALKVFLWDFFGIYSWFWMCAFVYIPYGSQFSTLLNEYQILPWKSSYAPGLLELQSMFVTPLVATQGLKIVFEKIIPYFLLQAARKTKDAKTRYDIYHNTLAQGLNRLKKTNQMKSPRHLTDLLFQKKIISKRNIILKEKNIINPQKIEKEKIKILKRLSKRIESTDNILFQQQRQWYLDRVLEQSNQNPHDTFADYADTLVQFGYVIQFTCVWPFIPLCAVINNYFEVRSSAFQLAYTSARVVPQRTSSMGSWNLFLRFNNIWAIFINVGLICYASGLVESFFSTCIKDQVTLGYAQHLPPMVPNFSCIDGDTRFHIFLILEHFLVFIYFTLTFSINSIPSSIKRIIKTKDKVLKEHFASQVTKHGEINTKELSVDEITQYEAKHQILCEQLETLLVEHTNLVKS